MNVTRKLHRKISAESAEILRSLRNAEQSEAYLVKEDKQMAFPKERKKEIVEEFKIHEKDTGSPAVQIALLSERITSLTEHLKTYRKDFNSREGLLKLVSQRRHLLNYLKKHNLNLYHDLIKKLDLRR